MVIPFSILLDRSENILDSEFLVLVYVRLICFISSYVLICESIHIKNAFNCEMLIDNHGVYWYCFKHFKIVCESAHTHTHILCKNAKSNLVRFATMAATVTSTLRTAVSDVFIPLVVVILSYKIIFIFTFVHVHNPSEFSFNLTFNECMVGICICIRNTFTFISYFRSATTALAWQRNSNANTNNGSGICFDGSFLSRLFFVCLFLSSYWMNQFFSFCFVSLLIL